MSAERATILLVDDREENLVAMAALLRRDDAEVLLARSGAAALEVLLQHDVALAIVDVQMPEMDGLELAALMRGTTRTRDVPIIFVTAGLHDEPRILRAYEMGAVDFLHKPIEPVVLRGKVDVFLHLHRTQRQLAAQVAELRRAESALRESDRRKDEFLAVLSHELRNPLTPIQNGIYLMARAAPGSEQARRAQEIIGRQARHLERLVNDLLDVTRIARGKVHLQRATLDLGDALGRAVEDHRSAFAAKGVDIALEVPPAPVWIDGDATRIAQVAGNLLGNALKFTCAGSAVAVTLRHVGTEAVVSVADEGMGIPPELLGRIFEPFTQADVTLARTQGGLGLGLALVKGMVELHGGTVSASSAGAGRGATFTVRLPTAAPRPAPAPPPRPAADGRRRRILVVEDNEDAASTLRDALELLGHEVHVAADGHEGVAAAARIAPDVVVCDIGLPGIDGYEVARRLRAVSPGLRLVALSGYALPEDRERARKAGFDAHIAKPPDLDELTGVVSGG